MTTFIFMLTPDAGSAAVDRVITELDAAFPQHEFMAGDPDICGYENNILALHGRAGNGDEPGNVVLLDTNDVREIRALFRRILDDLKGWKPS